MLRTLAAVAAFTGLSLAQTPDSNLTFDVASIKPAAPQQMGKMMSGMRGGPGTPDPGQATFTNASLELLVEVAYHLKSFQVSGPSWLDSARFDVKAKVPQGATQEQFQVMLQNLLAERFKLKVHREQKIVPLYALGIARGGPRLKESTAPAAASPDPARDPRAQYADGPPPKGPDGHVRMPPGGRGTMIGFGPNGFHMQGQRATSAQIADLLAMQLGRPVIDETGLKAEYDFTLIFAAEGLGGMRGMPIGGPPGGGPEPPRDADPAPSLFSAVQEQLGLKLESKKGPVDLIVVDSVEKTPTEN